MSKLRTFVFFLGTGLWPTSASAALDGHLPNYSATHWTVFLVGCCVIALAFIYLEGRFAPKNEGVDGP